MKLTIPVIGLGLFVAPAALADYTLELRNGRRITVDNYREEGGMIKVRGLGGEIGIGKDQILAIHPARAEDSASFNLRQVTPPPAAPPAASAPESGKPSTAGVEDERAKEDKGYQDRLKALTEELKNAREQYLRAVRGTGAAETTQLHTDEQLRVHADDVNSRFKNARQNPSEPQPVRLLVPSPFSSVAPKAESFDPAPFPSALSGPTPYTERERELTNLRERANQLENERQRLINEMQKKNLSTGSLFLD